MSFLKDLGKAIAKGNPFVNAAIPLLTSFIPGQAGALANTIAQVYQKIIDVEALGATLKWTGPQKLQYAVMLVKPILINSPLVANKIQNPALFDQATTGLINSSVDLLNSLKSPVIEAPK